MKKYLVSAILVIGLLSLAIFRDLDEAELPQPAEPEKVVVQEKRPTAVVPKTLTPKPVEYTYNFSFLSRPLKIRWTNAKEVITVCGVGRVEMSVACYDEETNTIHARTKSTADIDEEKDFVIYHEIAHSIFGGSKFPRDIFQESSLFKQPDHEVIADDFATWIYGQKYPEQAQSVLSNLGSAKIKYFEQVCSKVCVAEILSIEIK